MAEAFSALAHEAAPGKVAAPRGVEPRVTLAEYRPALLLQVETWPDTDAQVRTLLSSAAGVDPPAGLGTASGNEDLAVMTIAFGRYLLVGRDAALAKQITETIPAELGSAFDLSHARSAIRLSGEGAALVLRKGPPVDFDARVFPPGSVASTGAARMGLLIHRRAANIFDLFVFRSHGVHFWEWLADAAFEFGYRVEAAVS